MGVVVKGVKTQNSMCNTTDEVAGFWNIINAAVQMGELKKDQDFKIKTVGALTTNKVKIDNWAMPKSILMIRKDITMAVYRKLGRQMDENLLPKESLLALPTDWCMTSMVLPKTLSDLSSSLRAVCRRR